MQNRSRLPSKHLLKSFSLNDGSSLLASALPPCPIAPQHSISSPLVQNQISGAFSKEAQLPNAARNVDHVHIPPLLYSRSLPSSPSQIPIPFSTSPNPLLLQMPMNSATLNSAFDGFDKNKLSPGLRLRIQKTKLCVHHLHGRCARGTSCAFAHSVAELRPPPNLYKTRLCTSYTNYVFCAKGNNCRFAHGPHELRTAEDPAVVKSRDDSANSTTATTDSPLLANSQLCSPPTPIFTNQANGEAIGESDPWNLEADAVDALLRLPEATRQRVVDLIIRTLNGSTDDNKPRLNTLLPKCDLADYEVPVHSSNPKSIPQNDLDEQLLYKSLAIVASEIAGTTASNGLQCATTASNGLQCATTASNGLQCATTAISDRSLSPNESEDHSSLLGEYNLNTMDPKGLLAMFLSQTAITADLTNTLNQYSNESALTSAAQFLTFESPGETRHGNDDTDSSFLFKSNYFDTVHEVEGEESNFESSILAPNRFWFCGDSPELPPPVVKE